MNVEQIEILSFSSLDDICLRKISQNIGKIFPFNIKARQEYTDLIGFFDAGRKQYNANLLLNYVENTYARENKKTIAIVSVDLFIPIFTYIFGQAVFNGNSGIVSCHRLHNEPYGMPENKQLFLDRLTKEIIHELGHCFGLIHCFSPECVMRSGSYVEDIDLKKSEFCRNCLLDLEKK